MRSSGCQGIRGGSSSSSSLALLPHPHHQRPQSRVSPPVPQQQQHDLLADAWCQRQSLGRADHPAAARSSQRAAHITPHAYQSGYGYNQATSTQPAGPPSQFGRMQDNNGSRGGPSGPPGTNTALVSQGGDGSSTALKAKEQPKMVQVRFWLKFHVDYGQTIRIIGGHDQLGAWNLAKAPFLRWSEGDLWNVTMELAAGGVYEYKYVVVEADGTTAASWQRGSNNVLALQMNDEEVEVYDNWKNAPGALCVVDGEEVTRERKLLAWAGDMAVQRGELRRTRMELAQAREEIRVLRAELSVLRMEVSEANIARAAAEARQLELERSNNQLRLEVTASQHAARSTMEEAVRLLTDLSAEDAAFDDPSSSNSAHASLEPSNAGASSSSSNNGHSTAAAGAGGGGNGVFGGIFGFNVPGGNGRVQSKVGTDDTTGHGRAASAVVAAAAAMAAAADARPWGGPGSSSNGGGGYTPNSGS